MFAHTSLCAQTVIKVVSGTNGDALKAEISIGDTNLVSDLGIFSINISEKSLLSIKAEGYSSTERYVLPNENYTVYLFPDVKELQGIVVTDVHRNQSADQTVLIVDRIDAKKIKDLGAVDLKDALSFENNIRISRDNSIGSAGLSLMGLSGNNVKIMVDGVPVIGRLLGQLDLEQFNLDNAQQIEVIRGPMSVIYGSNALAGTINIISNKATKRSAGLTANYETDGQYNLSAHYIQPLNKNHSISFTGGRRLFDGWSYENSDRTFDWIPKLQYDAGVSYSYRKDSSSFSIRSNYFNAFLLDRGTPLAPYREFAIDQKFNNIRFDNVLNYYKIWKHSNLNLIASNNRFTRYKNKYYKNLVTLEEDLIPIAAEQDTQFFDAYLARAIYGFNHTGYETIIGLDINHEEATGQRIEEQQQRQSDFAVFSSTEIKFKKKLTARAGLRYAYNTAFDAPLLYSLQLKFIPKTNHLIKLAYGKGFRAPSLKELYLDFTDNSHAVYGNSSLKAETSHSITSSYLYFRQYKGISSSFNLDLFYNHITDKIDLLILGPIEATYGNISLYKTVGGSVGQQFEYKSLKLKLNFNYTGVYNGIANSEQKIFFSPQWVTQLSHTDKKHGLTINAFVNYFGRVNRVYTDTSSTELNISTLDPYTMIDLTVGKQLFNKRMNVNVGLRNLFNNQLIGGQTSEGAHSSSSNNVSISPGRTFFITVKYDLIAKNKI